jgi:hypothetical protein
MLSHCPVPFSLKYTIKLLPGEGHGAWIAMAPNAGQQGSHSNEDAKITSPGLSSQQKNGDGHAKP